MSAAAAIAAGCAAAGFDLCAAASCADVNARVAPALRLDDLGRPRALVLVIGNSRALWPRFAEALRADPALAAAADPLDTYAAATIGAVAAGALAGVRHAIYYAPDRPPRRVALQQLADAAGLAALMPSHLCVHPVYGPWIGLRAVIVADLDGPDSTPRPVRPCDCAAPDGCGAAFADAMAAGTPSGAVELRARWQRWLAVRDACPVGRDHRYGDDQLRYHYTGDRRALPR